MNQEAPGGTARDQTKHRLARAMGECMRSAPVDRITVRQIAERCGVTRQTFYRNFTDKYDLINWYFDILLRKSFEQLGSGRTIPEGLEKKFAYIREEKGFFMAAFRSGDSASVREHDFALILRFYTDLIQKKTGRAPDADTRFLLEMYCRGSIDMTSQWVLGGMVQSPAWLARRLTDALPAPLGALFETLGLLD